MTVSTPKYQLIEVRLGRPLAEQLRYWTRHKVSHAAMARMLAAETKIPLTGQTVRDWVRVLEINGEAA